MLSGLLSLPLSPSALFLVESVSAAFAAVHYPEFVFCSVCVLCLGSVLAAAFWAFTHVLVLSGEPQVKIAC
jgi:hypothetical protein